MRNAERLPVHSSAVLNGKREKVVIAKENNFQQVRVCLCVYVCVCARACACVCAPPSPASYLHRGHCSHLH